MQIALGRFDVRVSRERRNGFHGNTVCLQHRHIGVAAAMRRELTHLTDIFQRRIEASAEGANAIERVPSGAGPNIGCAAVFAEIAYIRAKLLRDRNGSAAADTLGWSELRHTVHHLHGIFNMNDGAVLADILRAKRQQLL